MVGSPNGNDLHASDDSPGGIPAARATIRTEAERAKFMARVLRDALNASGLHNVARLVEADHDLVRLKGLLPDEAAQLAASVDQGRTQPSA